MKRCLGLLVASLFFAVPMLVAQESDHMDHVEIGAFANYYRLSDPGPTRNFLGLGGRAAFGIRPSIQLEAEMAYDFKRNYTNTFTDGVNSLTVNTKFPNSAWLLWPEIPDGLGPLPVLRYR